MPEQGLDDPDIRTALKQVRLNTVA